MLCLPDVNHLFQSISDSYKAELIVILDDSSVGKV